MNKLIADIIINVAIVDSKGNLIRTENLEWNTEEGEEVVLTQIQIRDAIDALCDFLEVPSIPVPKTKESKSKDE